MFDMCLALPERYVGARPPRRWCVPLAHEAFECFSNDGLDGGHFIVGQLLKFTFAPLAALACLRSGG